MPRSTTNEPGVLGSIADLLLSGLDEVRRGFDTFNPYVQGVPRDQEINLGDFIPGDPQGNLVAKAPNAPTQGLAALLESVLYSFPDDILTGGVGAVGTAATLPPDIIRMFTKNKNILDASGVFAEKFSRDTTEKLAKQSEDIADQAMKKLMEDKFHKQVDERLAALNKRNLGENVLEFPSEAVGVNPSDTTKVMESLFGKEGAESAKSLADQPHWTDLDPDELDALRQTADEELSPGMKIMKESFERYFYNRGPEKGIHPLEGFSESFKTLMHPKIKKIADDIAEIPVRVHNPDYKGPLRENNRLSFYERTDGTPVVYHVIFDPDTGRELEKVYNVETGELLLSHIRKVPDNLWGNWEASKELKESGRVLDFPDRFPDFPDK